MKRFGTVVALGALLGFGLGCGSLMGGMDVGQGLDAEHPADFAFPPPKAGSLEFSTDTTMMGKHTVTVTYLMSESEAADAIEMYKGVLENDLGLKPTVSDMAGMKSLSAVDGDGTVYSASASDSGTGETRLSLIVSKDA